MNFIVYISLLLYISSFSACAQVSRTYNQNQLGLQYGASLKAAIEFGNKAPLLRLGVTSGVSRQILNFLYPAYNIEIQLYNGGLGSRSRTPVQKKLISFDLINAFMLTLGSQNMIKKTGAESVNNWNVPLYCFADFSYPSLLNPYKYSLSFGTNIILPITDKAKSKQRIGIINIHIGRFQFSYYNDGGLLIPDLYLGDAEDRFYTGGGVFSYHLPASNAIDLIELSFHKFSGYSKHSFQLADELEFAFVNYKDPSQEYYNKGYFGLNIASTTKGIGLNYRLNNGYSSDFQHKIHYQGNYSYHFSPYPVRHTLSTNYYKAFNSYSEQ